MRIDGRRTWLVSKNWLGVVVRVLLLPIWYRPVAGWRYAHMVVEQANTVRWHSKTAVSSMIDDTAVFEFHRTVKGHASVTGLACKVCTHASTPHQWSCKVGTYNFRGQWHSGNCRPCGGTANWQYVCICSYSLFIVRHDTERQNTAYAQKITARD